MDLQDKNLYYPPPASNLSSTTKNTTKKNGIILNLSDMHYTDSVDEESEKYLIISDLKKVYFDNPDDKLNLKDISYLVISGDFVENGGDITSFKKAYHFIDLLCKEFNLPHERVVIVPGNHDLSWGITMASYDLAIGIPRPIDRSVATINNDSFYLKKDDKACQEKFFNYSEYLYKTLYGTSFPKEPKEQLKVISGDFIDGRKIAFFAMNTPANIDHFTREVTYFDIESMVKETRKLDENTIKIAVGHHPVNLTNSNGDDIPFGNALQNENFKIYLHGHVHREISLNFFNPQNVNPNMIMLGAGALSTGEKKNLSMWSGTPQRYNVIRISKTDDTDKILITVNTRQRERLGAHWQPAYIYYNESDRKMTNLWKSII
jgi:predicted MPP superfamily phosphohydrolase